MQSIISLRLPDDVLKSLDNISKMIERPRTFLIKKALENYISEYADYQIAIERLRDKDDAIISGKELRKQLGI